MTSQQILQSDLLDILFEHRNKEYGAYQLRKTYSRQLIKAVVASISIAILLLFIFKPSYLQKAIASTERREVTVDLTPLAEAKKPDPPKLPDPPRSQVRQEIFTNQLALKEHVENPIPPINDLEKVAISDIKADGPDVGTIQPPTSPEMNGNGSTNTQPKPEPEKEVIPDRQPQFPGGNEAWIAFLSNNLRAPQELENGEKLESIKSS